MQTQTLPVAVIGAGPIGLAAAAHLAQYGQPFVVLEAGESAAAGVRSWGHVRVFSPWKYNVDKAAAALLEDSGWQMPEPDEYPTGHELAQHYLAPLADLPQIKPFVMFDTRVTAIARKDMDKMKAVGREDAPFVITYIHADGQEEQLLARAIIDASGGKLNPLGANGTPALGERSVQDQITYGIPDILGIARARFANKRVLVVGSGHSAFNSVLDLIVLCDDAPETAITWAVRRGATGQMFGGGNDDELGRRGALGQRAKLAVESGRVEFVTGFRIQRVYKANAGVWVESDARRLGPFDEIISATGYRPDLSILGELRLSIHEGTEGVSAIAPLIDPNFHSCGSVPPHGAEELKHPEPDFYIVGMKSYGRAPTFLMMTGYEQVRSVVAALAGDWEAARKVELVLPDTGVCSSSRGASDEAGCCGDSCCTTTTEISPIGVTSGLIALDSILVSASAADACCESDCCGGTYADQTLIQIPLNNR